MAEYVVVDKEQLEADLTTVADAIREKGGTSDKLSFPSGMESAVKAIESGGGSDNPLQYASMDNGYTLFRGSVFSEDYHLIYRIAGNTSNVNLNLWFSYSNVSKVTMKLDNIPTTFILSFAFSGCTKLTEVTFENNPITPTAFTNTFNDCTKLETVNGVIDLSGCTSGSFNYLFGKCYLLKEIRFVENSINLSLNLASCYSLSAESIQSIIDGLATVETTQTLTLWSDSNPAPSIRDNLTEAQLTTITAKNWTLA